MRKINSETGEFMIIGMMVVAIVMFVWFAALLS